MGRQWHQMLHTLICCTSLPRLHLNFYMPDALPDAQSTASKHIALHNNNTQQQQHTTILRPFVRDYQGELVPKETFTHPPTWSSSNLYQLLPSTTMHSILPVQITCLAIFTAIINIHCHCGTGVEGTSIKVAMPFPPGVEWWMKKGWGQATG